MIVQMSEVLQKRLDDVTNWSQSVSTAPRGTQDGRSWAIDEFVAQSDGIPDLTKPTDEATKAIFSRETLENQYSKAREADSGGKKGDFAFATSQSDMLSGFHRDFTARHKSRIRRIAHETAARAFLGCKSGAIQTSVLSYFQLMAELTGE